MSFADLPVDDRGAGVITDHQRLRNRSGDDAHPQYALEAEVASVPTGALLEFAGTSAPDGFLLCDGSDVSRASFAALFAVIGETFGPGDGSLTFTLPDFTDRFGVGVSGTKSLGATGGSANAVVVAHVHDTNVYASSNEAAGYGLAPAAGFQNRVQVTATTGENTDSTGVSGTNANLPPYVAVNRIIKT